MVEVERYFCFAAEDYNIKGGLDDLLIKSDLFEEVEGAIRDHESERTKNSCYWMYWIIDMETSQRVPIRRQ